MAKYYRAGDYLWIKAIEENGIYKLLFTSCKRVSVATKCSRKHHTEDIYNYYDKVFTSKSHANNYFRKVKENNPQLKLVTLAEYQKQPN